jgi:hypothetical protein
MFDRKTSGLLGSLSGSKIMEVRVVKYDCKLLGFLVLKYDCKFTIMSRSLNILILNLVPFLIIIY